MVYNIWSGFRACAQLKRVMMEKKHGGSFRSCTLQFSSLRLANLFNKVLIYVYRKYTYFNSRPGL